MPIINSSTNNDIAKDIKLTFRILSEDKVEVVFSAPPNVDSLMIYGLYKAINDGALSNFILQAIYQWAKINNNRSVIADMIKQLELVAAKGNGPVLDPEHVIARLAMIYERTPT